MKLSTHHAAGACIKPSIGRCFMVVAGIALGAGEVQGAEPVTLDQAVTRALARPALVAALSAEADAAETEAEFAAVWPNPEVTWEREQIGGDPGEVEETVSLSQPLDLSGRRGLRADAARRRGAAVRLDGVAQSRRTAVETRRRFWEVVHNQARHVLAGGWLQRLEDAEALTVARERAGEGSRYDVLRMGREVRRARTDLGVSEVDREGAWLDLLSLTGPLSAPTGWPRVKGELVPVQENVETPDGAERPDLKAWAMRAEAAGLEADAAGRGWIPELGLTGGWKRVSGQDSEDQGYVAGVSLSVPLFDRGQGQGARARANQARAEAIHELLVEDARRQALPAKERARRLTALARAMRMETEADNRALEVTAQAAWLAGEANLIELLDVHRNARDDRLALLSLERAARSAREALRLITLEEAP